MRAILQRVQQASVEVEGVIVGQITKGWLVLLGIRAGDTAADLTYLANKTLELRGFCDEQHKMNLNIQDIHGQILVVSQFTLYGDCRKGRRPGFSEAATGDEAVALYENYVKRLQEANLKVETGRFGAAMAVHMVGDGPVTLMLDSRRAF